MTNQVRIHAYLTQLMNSFKISDEVLTVLDQNGFVFKNGELLESTLYYCFLKRLQVEDKAGKMDNCAFHLSIGYEDGSSKEPHVYLECKVGEIMFYTDEGVGTPILFDIHPNTLDKALEWATVFPAEYKTKTYEQWDHCFMEWLERTTILFP